MFEWLLIGAIAVLLIGLYWWEYTLPGRGFFEDRDD